MHLISRPFAGKPSPAQWLDLLAHLGTLHRQYGLALVVIDTLGEISGIKPRRRHLPAAPGEPRHTGASINLARERLGWEPRVSLRDGLTKQWEWFLATSPKSPKVASS